jgi:dipeptidyl-peptidase-4
MKKIIAAFLILLVHNSVTAQNKMLSMEDAMLKARTTLAPQNLTQLQFYGATNDYIYLKKMDGKDVWLKGNYRSAADSVFLTLDGLNNKLKQSGLDAVKDMPAIKFTPGRWTMTINGSKISLEPVLNTFKMVVPKELVIKENVEEGNAGLYCLSRQF